MKRFKYYNKLNKYTRDEGMTVTVRNNDVAGAMRVLKKKLMNEGLFQELRERSYHQTKGEKRRKAKAAGKRRWERKLAKRKQELGY